MTTSFINSEIRDIFKNMFESNDYNIYIHNEDSGEETTTSIVDYLNVDFYSWRNRVVDIDAEHTQIPFQSWVESIEDSMNDAYGLVEIQDETTQISADIDNGTIDCKITFMVNSNKIEQLEAYLAHLREIYKGVPQTIVNRYGKSLKALIFVGALIPVDDPALTQIGDTIFCECGFSISYLLDALAYTDETLQVSFDGTNFFDIIVSKDTHQLIFQAQANPKANRPDIAGDIATSATRVETLTFFVFSGSSIMDEIKEIFNKYCAVMVWDNESQEYVEAPIQNIRQEIFIKVESGDGDNKKGYIYKNVFTQIEKVRSNSDFTIMSITMKTSGF